MVNHRLKDILPDFQSFLLERELALEKYAPFYALRASQFLAFANKDNERDLEALVQKCLDHLKDKEI